METDAQRMRLLHASTRPYVMSSLRSGQGLAAVVRFIETRGLLVSEPGRIRRLGVARLPAPLQLNMFVSPQTDKACPEIVAARGLAR